MKLSLKLVAILGIIGFQSIGAYWEKPDWLETDFRLGFGPAWTSELGDTRYTYTGTNAQGTTQNQFPFNVGPWLDGTLQTQLCKYFIADIYAGGGWLRKGYGKIVQKILVSSTTGLPSTSNYHEYDTDITGDFLTTYAGGGLCYNHLDSFFITLTAGYAFNRQLWNTVQLIVPYTHCIKNQWKSPYIGIGGRWDLCQCLQFSVNYRALIGHAMSQDIVTLYGTKKANVCRSVPKFFGNLVSLNCIYQFADCWETDLCFIYNSFQSFKKGCVAPSFTPTTTNAYFNRLRFNMFAFTLGLGYIY